MHLPYASVTFAPVAGREVGIGRRFGLPGAGDFHRCLRISYSIFIVYCSHIYTDYRKGARPMSFFGQNQPTIQGTMLINMYIH